MGPPGIIIGPSFFISSVAWAEGYIEEPTGSHGVPGVLGFADAL